MRIHLAIPLTTALAACMSMARGLGTLPPGYGVTPDLARQLQCDYDALRAHANAYRREAGQLPTGTTLVPRVGMDHCEVLAMVGVPDNLQQIETTHGEAMVWHYQTGSTASSTPVRMHRVEFHPDPSGRPVVTSVVW